MARIPISLESSGRRLAPSRVGPSLGALLLLLATAAQAQSTRAPAEASRHFERGYLLAQQGSLEEAIREFQQAYALQPHPSVLYNLGQAYAASGRAVEAVDTLSRFLEQAPAGDAERRTQAAALMEYQAQRIGSVLLRVAPAGATVSVDGVRVGTAPLTEAIRLTAGPHALVITLGGYEPRAEAIRVSAKGQIALSIELARSVPPALAPARDAGARSEAVLRSIEERQRRSSLQRTTAILLGGVGLTGLTLGGVLYVSNQARWEDWQRDSRRRLSASSAAPARELEEVLAQENTLRNRDAWALALAVAGGVMGASSAALWLALPDAQTGSVDIRWGEHAWVGYSGTF